VSLEPLEPENGLSVEELFTWIEEDQNIDESIKAEFKNNVEQMYPGKSYLPIDNLLDCMPSDIRNLIIEELQKQDNQDSTPT